MGFPDRDASDCPGIIPGILQGFGGSGMAPVAQSILADSVPPVRLSRCSGLRSLSRPSLAAPGGWIADNYTWQWNKACPTG
jgi:DHA2 family multidrug resistance protein